MFSTDFYAAISIFCSLLHCPLLVIKKITGLGYSRVLGHILDPEVVRILCCLSNLSSLLVRTNNHINNNQHPALLLSAKGNNLHSFQGHMTSLSSQAFIGSTTVRAVGSLTSWVTLSPLGYKYNVYSLLRNQSNTFWINCLKMSPAEVPCVHNTSECNHLSWVLHKFVFVHIS